MTEISASLVKDLREKTGAGMMDCKKALGETKGNLEEAVDWLRKKGLAAAAKKAGRTAADGLVALKTSGTQGVAVELNAETDFVARNEQFQALARGIAEVALNAGVDVEKIKAQAYPGTGRTVQEEITHAISVIGENMNLRRASAISVKEGVVAQYIHNASGSGIGKIGVLVALESSGKKDVLEALGKQIAMHVAAAKPIAATSAEVDASALEREKEIFKDQAKASGKPDNIIEKMIEGRIRKFYEEVVLLEQVFVIDGKTKVADAIKAAEKDAGAPIALKGFISFVLGEGVEKEQTDFAAEVRAAAGA